MDQKDYQVDRSPRIFEQVSQQIVEYIRENHLKSGNQVPPERKLCELLQVSRSSIRESLKIMELLSFLRSRQGEGTFVQQPVPYLIPNRILNIPAAAEELQKYFAVFIMCSKELIISALGKDDFVEPTTELLGHDHQHFWDEFHQWIKSIENQSENTYCGELWDCTYRFLSNNHYFEHPPEKMTMEQILEPYRSKDVLRILQCMETLQLHLEK